MLCGIFSYIDYHEIWDIHAPQRMKPTKFNDPVHFSDIVIDMCGIPAAEQIAIISGLDLYIHIPHMLWTD